MSLQLRLWWLRLRLLPSSPSSPSLLWLLRRKRLRLLRHRCPCLCRSCPELLRHRAGCSELRRCCSGCPSRSEGAGSAGSPGSAGSGQDLVIDRGQAPPPRRGMSGQAFELSSPPVAHGWRTTLRSFNSRCKFEAGPHCEVRLLFLFFVAEGRSLSVGDSGGQAHFSA